MNSLVTVSLLAFFYGSSALAQSQRRTSLGDTKACYGQAQAYVATQNHNSVPLSGQPWAKTSYTFVQAHYDGTAQVCYALVNGETPVYPPDSVYRAETEQVLVVDAFEGKTIANLTDGWSVDGQGAIVRSKPTSCQVNGEKCGGRPEFNGLLWKLIPAFQPVDCFTEENGKREPCKKAAN